MRAAVSSSLKYQKLLIFYFKKTQKNTKKHKKTQQNTTKHKKTQENTRKHKIKIDWPASAPLHDDDFSNLKQPVHTPP